MSRSTDLSHIRAFSHPFPDSLAFYTPRFIHSMFASCYSHMLLRAVSASPENVRLANTPKSVAHIPGRTMAYKFLNTFIDDLFAFTIKMPLLHRLATLRDDVIFFIYLYQAWKYKVDYSRVNEFGQGGEEEEVEEKTASKPLTAPAGADGKVKVESEGKAENKAEGKTTAAANEEGEGRRRQ